MSSRRDAEPLVFHHCYLVPLSSLLPCSTRRVLNVTNLVKSCKDPSDAESKMIVAAMTCHVCNNNPVSPVLSLPSPAVLPLPSSIALFSLSRCLAVTTIQIKIYSCNNFTDGWM